MQLYLDNLDPNNKAYRHFQACDRHCINGYFLKLLLLLLVTVVTVVTVIAVLLLLPLLLRLPLLLPSLHFFAFFNVTN